MPQPKSSSSRTRSSSSRAKSSTARAKRATSPAADQAQDRTSAALQAVRDRLTRGVVVTAESIHEALDEAVTRGRMTRADAQQLANDLVSRGRRQAEDFLQDVEALLGRGRKEATQRSDRVLREVDRARRATHIGSFPILSYDDLDVRQITARLGELSPAELRKVRDYEKRNANRKSVLAAVERRLR